MQCGNLNLENVHNCTKVDKVVSDELKTLQLTKIVSKKYKILLAMKELKTKYRVIKENAMAIK